MQINTTSFAGCLEVMCPVSHDKRGSFVKVFHHDNFQANGLRTDWKEEYYSVSARHVLRGMHFQTPPADHAKFVFCSHGTILDVLVDLRQKSPTFGQNLSFELCSQKGNGIYIPPGIAHGFLSLTENAMVQYKVTSMYSPENDCGILWSSIGFSWPISNPVISDRDSHHPQLSSFESPFLI
jgi:dTDP-4-dehydrorhamnose 3,5-epimerase